MSPATSDGGRETTFAWPLTRAVPLALEPEAEPGTLARAALALGAAEIGRLDPSTRSGTSPKPLGLTGRADPLTREVEPAGGTETEALAEPLGRTFAVPEAQPEPLGGAGIALLGLTEAEPLTDPGVADPGVADPGVADPGVADPRPGTVARPLTPLVGVADPAALAGVAGSLDDGADDGVAELGAPGVAHRAPGAGSGGGA